ncbi:MAG: histidine kinase N-terminal 7TM domain-containing protein [Chloroflexota bacterium]|nr:histidine kinase N-terminal 7TM domain-containing protein [Chloroflexota bacterium]
MLIGIWQTTNQLLTVGIAITAFSLLLYALSFNLKNKVARSFAFIMWCVVVVFVGETVASVLNSTKGIETWLRIQWVGLVFLPSAYLQISDAILATTGRPSRGRRTLLVRLTYVISIIFLATIPTSRLVGPLVVEGVVAPHLERTPLTWTFSIYYLISMVWTWVNFWRAYKRTVTSSSRRRMGYLIGGALAPALGSYPYLLFGSVFAYSHPTTFWLTAIFSNILVLFLIILMAYSVAFFGVPWPDRVVKRRLVKWVMRGPMTASTVLATVTIMHRAGGLYADFAPVVMVGTLLLMQYLITIFAPVWERLLLGGYQEKLKLVQSLEERLLTREDLRQLLEALLAAVCDRLQIKDAFLVSVNFQELEFLVTMGQLEGFQEDELSKKLLQVVEQQEGQHQERHLFAWGKYWLAPLFQGDDSEVLLGILGMEQPAQELPLDQRDALFILVQRISQALEDRYMQQEIFTSLEEVTQRMKRVQRLRAATRYDSAKALIPQNGDINLDEGKLAEWVKDALSDYWGGPKLSESPLLQLKVVQQALDEHDGISVKAVRSILRDAIENIRPEGKRRFTLEWVLYNILELKFMRGRKVRDVAKRLAMSEANLYRKQKVAVEVVAKAIIEMERQARAKDEGENERGIPQPADERIQE